MSTQRIRPRLEGLEGRLTPSTFYVSTTGSNSNPGTSAAPWKTLQFAADSVRAGDTVVVRAGDYAGFQLTASGTASAPITFQADPGARVTTRNPSTSDGINLEGASYAVIQGFTVVNQPRAGIRVVTDNHVTIRGNTCDSNTVWGIFTAFSDDVLIEGNTASHSAQQHGIYVSNSGDRPVVRNNTVFGNNQAGIHMNGDISNGGDGIISNALVEGNVIYSNGAGGASGINCDGVQNSTFRNNLIYDEHANGISLYQIDGGGPSTNNVVENNTILIASDGRWGLNITDGATGTAVRNNVLYNNGSTRGSIEVSADSRSGLVSDYNAVMNRFSTDGGNTVQTLAQWRTATGQDAHSFTTTPAALFANPAGNDYHLKAGSPAIDTGTPTGAPATDFEGDPRPLGKGYDIGADEYRLVIPPAPPPPPMNQVPPQPFAVGSDEGRVGTVTVYNPDGSVRYAAQPFGASYTGGVKVAAGDVTGDGVPDVVVGTTTGAGKARVIDGATHALRPGSVFSSSSYTGLVEVAVGDVTGDGVADVAVATNEGRVRVRVYRGGDFAKVADFAALAGSGYAGRGRVALADVTGDGVADLAVSGLFADGTHVAVIDGATLRAGVTPARAVPDFALTGAGFAGGVNLAAGDLDGDGSADLVFGSASGGSRVLALSGRDLRAGTRTTLADFTASGTDYANGVRVALRELDGDGRADLLVGSCGGAGSEVRSYLGRDFTPTGGEPPLAFDFAAYAGFTGGVFVG